MSLCEHFRVAKNSFGLAESGFRQSNATNGVQRASEDPEATPKPNSNETLSTRASRCPTPYIDKMPVFESWQLRRKAIFWKRLVIVTRHKI
jgi:hypothetical protein